MKKIKTIIFFLMLSFTFANGQTVHFTFTSNTGNNATIAILTGTSPNINGLALSNGDEIGAFSPEGLCVGAVVWNNSNTALVVWGDNSQTPTKDGMTPGDSIHYRIWDQSENYEFKIVTCTYNQNSPFNFSGKYSPDAIYNLLSLSAVGGVRVIIEGFYNESLNRLNMRDTVKAYLRNTASPYSIVDSSKAVIDTISFFGNFEFTNAASGTFYLVITHRNSIETWSASGGISFIEGRLLSYDFTIAQNKAYGNNLTQKGTKWCIYSGDVDQDGIVDLTDLVLVDNDNANFVTGYVASDVNGDNKSDLSDLIIVDNNNAAFVGKVVPPGALAGKKMRVQNQESNNDPK